MWKLLNCSLGCLLWGVSSGWSQNSSLSDLFESSPTTDLPKLEIQVVFVPEIITPGAETELQVQIFIPAGWHIYSIKPAGEFGPEPTTLTILSGHTIVTPLKESSPIRFYDDAFAQELSVHQYGLELRLRIRVAPDQPSGYNELRAQLEYQVCDNRICAPLQTALLVASLTIEQQGDSL